MRLLPELSDAVWSGTAVLIDTVRPVALNDSQMMGKLFGQVRASVPSFFFGVDLGWEHQSSY